jgi:hypothetical protein
VTVGRFPAVYPADPQDVFPYYQYNASWRDAPAYYYVQTKEGSQSPYDLDKQVLEGPNFIHGSSHEIDFRGIAPAGRGEQRVDPASARLRGSASRGQLPDRQDGIMLSWTGPRYDRYGGIIGDGAQTTCLRYRADEKAPHERRGLRGPRRSIEHENELVANMYTGPWDTEDGVKFEWVPVENSIDTVTITVRFLGPSTSRTEPGVGVRARDADPEALEQFEAAEGAGLIPTARLPVGYRAALPCDDPNDIEWTVDPEPPHGGRRVQPALQGNPTHTMIELTCQVADSDGEFLLTKDIVQEALDYADVHDAQGTVFYFSRSRQDSFETRTSVTATANATRSRTSNSCRTRSSSAASGTRDEEPFHAIPFRSRRGPRALGACRPSQFGDPFKDYYGGDSDVEISGPRRDERRGQRRWWHRHHPGLGLRRRSDSRDGAVRFAERDDRLGERRRAPGRGPARADPGRARRRRGRNRRRRRASRRRLHLPRPTT